MIDRYINGGNYLFQDGQVITTDVVTQHRKTDPLTVSFYYQQNRSKKKNLATFLLRGSYSFVIRLTDDGEATASLYSYNTKIAQRVTPIYNQPSSNPSYSAQSQ